MCILVKVQIARMSSVYLRIHVQVMTCRLVMLNNDIDMTWALNSSDRFVARQSVYHISIDLAKQITAAPGTSPAP